MSQRRKLQRGRTMSQLRESILLVFERLGLGAPPLAYVERVEALNAAALEWHRAAPGGGVLAFELPDLLTPGPIQTGSLQAAIDYGWATNEPAKDFIRYIDARTDHQATLLQLQVIILIQQAVQANKVNSRGGSA